MSKKLRVKNFSPIKWNYHSSTPSSNGYESDMDLIRSYDSEFYSKATEEERESCRYHL